jgi:hypothetical protein
MFLRMNINVGRMSSDLLRGSAYSDQFGSALIVNSYWLKLGFANVYMSRLLTELPW